MIIASHQPYFFPYLGYFSLISAVDTFIFFDTAQYTRRSWMKRNRMLKPGRENFQYINIALQKPEFKTTLSECRINNDTNWKEKLFRQIEHYKKPAPFYGETLTILHDIFSAEDDLLHLFNERSILHLLKLLEIKTPVKRFSQMESGHSQMDHLWDWALMMCHMTQADTYINAPGGEAIYPENIFREAGIKMGYIQHRLRPYNQKNSRFIPALSILDVLMFNGISETQKIVKEYSIKWIR